MAAESSLFCEEAGGAETRSLRFLLCMVRDFALRFYNQGHIPYFDVVAVNIAFCYNIFKK